jgi:uncharacterized protein YndB with AHSA1/START domain
MCNCIVSGVINFTEMKDVMIKEQVFYHSIDAVWKAISTQEEIQNWLSVYDRFWDEKLDLLS